MEVSGDEGYLCGGLGFRVYVGTPIRTIVCGCTQPRRCKNLTSRHPGGTHGFGMPRAARGPGSTLELIQVCEQYVPLLLAARRYLPMAERNQHAVGSPLNPKP